MYLFRRHEAAPRQQTPERARQLVEEAQLFLEASHACRARLAAGEAGAAAPQVPAR